MKKLLSTLPIILLFLQLTAQSGSGVAEIIKGKVINRASNEAVPFTNISIEDTYYGTASDEEGNFELKIPEEMVNDRIQFSAVGYKNEKYPVKTLFNKEYIIIKLEPTSYDIENVDIEAQSKVLLRILRMASENIPYNFIGGPFNLLCHYGNVKILDDTTEINQNAEVLIYDKTGYVNPSKRDAFQMRKYKISPAEPAYRFSSGILNFDEMIEMDWVRSASSVLNPGLLSQFYLKLEDEPEVAGKPAWVISFSQPHPTPEGSVDFHASWFEGKITIIKEDYSVTKIEGAARAPLQNRQGKSLAVGDSNTHHYKDVAYNFSVTYSQLKPDEILLNKKYLFNGQPVEESSRLKFEQVQMTGVKEIETRNYFVK